MRSLAIVVVVFVVRREELEGMDGLWELLLGWIVKLGGEAGLNTDELMKAGRNRMRCGERGSMFSRHSTDGSIGYGSLSQAYGWRRFNGTSS